MEYKLKYFEGNLAKYYLVCEENKDDIIRIGYSHLFKVNNIYIKQTHYNEYVIEGYDNDNGKWFGCMLFTGCNYKTFEEYKIEIKKANKCLRRDQKIDQILDGSL